MNARNERKIEGKIISKEKIKTLRWKKKTIMWRRFKRVVTEKKKKSFEPKIEKENKRMSERESSKKSEKLSEKKRKRS